MNSRRRTLWIVLISWGILGAVSRGQEPPPLPAGPNVPIRGWTIDPVPGHPPLCHCAARRPRGACRHCAVPFIPVIRQGLADFFDAMTPCTGYGCCDACGSSWESYLPPQHAPRGLMLWPCLPETQRGFEYGMMEESEPALRETLPPPANGIIDQATPDLPDVPAPPPFVPETRRGAPPRLHSPAGDRSVLLRPEAPRDRGIELPIPLESDDPIGSAVRPISAEEAVPPRASNPLRDHIR